ncbi:uncharacterized protein [Palaemon carinicauda]|uniref:uncharacterized protein n=1 Tax=Palaemon carinicauda TaxID=392227 RepID=UPI0035B58D1F
MQTTKSDTLKNSLQAKISHVENELKDSHEKQRNWEETQAVCNIKANPKFFFKYCKKFSKTQVKIVLEPAEFFKVHTQHHLTLVNISFTITDVQEAISELKIYSAAGPDGVPSILLLRCKEALALPLYKFWRCSLDNGIIPSILKEAIISPIHKGGDRSQAKNYRTQAVAVDGHKSQPEKVSSGVPQGSVLGPLLFLVLIADIEKTVTGSFLSSFADDTTLSHRISASEDVVQLHAHIQRVFHWADTNNM